MYFIGNVAFDYFFGIFAVISIPIALLIAAISIFKEIK